MTNEEEYYQKIIINHNSLRISEQFNNLKRFLNMYNSLLHDAIAWNSYEEEFYTLVINQIKDQLDNIAQLNDLIEDNWIKLDRFLEKEKEIAQDKNAPNKKR
jgi:hypothetical protein